MIFDCYVCLLCLVLRISLATFGVGHFRLGNHGHRYSRNTTCNILKVSCYPYLHSRKLANNCSRCV